MTDLQEILSFFVQNNLLLIVCISAVAYGLAAIIYKAIFQ